MGASVRHAIKMQDVMRGREVRTIVWDDEAGTVDGDHWDVQWLQSMLDRPAPVRLTDVAIHVTLRDPAHSTPDFLALLFGPTRGPVPDPELPDSLAGVEPTPWIGVPLEPGTVQ